MEAAAERPFLVFDEHTHTYAYDGRVINSVTQILGEWQKVNVYGTTYFVNTFTGKAVAEYDFTIAGDFGTAVHNAIRLYIEGTLLQDALHPDLKHALLKFKKWAEDFHVDLRHIGEVGSLSLCEERLYSAKYDFAGTPDLICPVMGKMAVVDFKTGFYTYAGPQTVAYEQMYKEKIGRRRALKRYALSLKKDAKEYKCVPLENKRDWQFFLSRLTTNRLLAERGII